MGLLRLAAGLAAGPGGVTAGLLAEPTRAAARIARSAAEAGTRVVGTLVTRADPMPDRRLSSLVSVARGLPEPPPTRPTRRVYADQHHVQVEVETPSTEDRSEVRRTLRHQLER